MRSVLLHAPGGTRFRPDVRAGYYLPFFEESVSFGEFMWSIIFSMIIFFMYTSSSAGR